MAEEGEAQNIVEPDDPEYELQEHVSFRHRQDILVANLAKLFSENVSKFSKIMDGTTYAYTCLQLKNLGLAEITEIVEKYPNLREIDLSQNILKQIPSILTLKYVINLNLSRNNISNISFLSRQHIFPYLRQINLLGNRVTDLPLIASKNLRKANFNNNVIVSLEEFDGHQKLEVLELRGNKIKSLVGIKKCPELRELYIAENEITSLSGLKMLPKLMKIHARKNKIATLGDYPEIESVKYLNLRQNLVDKVEKLQGVNNSVEILNLLGTPMEAELADNTKKEVWMLYRHYTKINKSEVTAEERQQFDADYKQILATRERERLQRQAAEKEQQEQES